MISGLFSLPFAPTDGAGIAVREPANTSFESFVAGPENALVRALAAAVIRRELSYNPIVLYGPAGTGKSSVAQSLVERRRQEFALNEVISTTAADVARALAHAVDMASVTDLRARHHRCDIVLVDNVHQLAGKAAAQEFVLAAIDALIRRGALVIVTLRHSPLATAGLAPQLVSRFMAGLVVGLSLPGPQARRELVQQTASRMGLTLTDNEMSRLAYCEGGGREPFLTAAKLRQSVLQLSANGELSSPLRKVKSRKTDGAPAKALCRQAASAVAKHFGLTLGELRGKTRRQVVADARGLAMYLARHLSGASYARIGREFGGRDHTTVLHACQKLATALSRDEFLRQLADELAEQIVSEGVT